MGRNWEPSVYPPPGLRDPPALCRLTPHLIDYPQPIRKRDYSWPPQCQSWQVLFLPLLGPALGSASAPSMSPVTLSCSPATPHEPFQGIKWARPHHRLAGKRQPLHLFALLGARELWHCNQYSLERNRQELQGEERVWLETITTTGTPPAPAGAKMLLYHFWAERNIWTVWDCCQQPRMG